jgi:uncharacterized protein
LDFHARIGHPGSHDHRGDGAFERQKIKAVIDLSAHRAQLIEHLTQVENRRSKPPLDPLFTGPGESPFDRFLRAIRKGACLDSIKALAPTFTELDHAKSDGKTALHEAALHGRVDAIEWLVSKGADLESLDDHQRTPLYFALASGDVTCIEAMMKAGARPNAQKPTAARVLDGFVHHGPDHDQAMVDRIFDSMVRHGCDVNRPDSQGGTALQIAACLGKLSSIKALVRLGADLNTSCLQSTGTGSALHQVVVNNHEACLGFLLSSGSEVDVLDVYLRTPLHRWAMRKRWIPSGQMLIDFGAKIDLQDKDGMTPLILAAWQGIPSAFNSLLGWGCNIHAKDNKGWTALHHSALTGDASMAIALLSRGMKLHAKSDKNETAHVIARLENKRHWIDSVDAFLNSQRASKAIDKLLSDRSNSFQICPQWG